MALVFETWRFGEATPALDRVVEAVRSHYDGNVDVHYETHTWNLEDDHSQALEDLTGIPKKGEEQTATLAMGDVEIEILKGLHGNQLRLCYRGGDAAHFNAIEAAMHSLGGEHVNPEQPTPEVRARLKRHVILGYFELIAIVLATGVLYYGKIVGPLGIIGLIVGYVILRFAFRIALAYRFIRKRYPADFTGDTT